MRRPGSIVGIKAKIILILLQKVLSTKIFWQLNLDGNNNVIEYGVKD